MKLVFVAILITAFAQGETPRHIAGRIRIEKTAAGVVRFAPLELVAWAGDLIHWYNDTDEAHEPGVIKKDGTFVAFLEELIAARTVSFVFSPLPRIDNAKKQVSFTIKYVCGRHPGEQGVIQIVPTP